MTKTKNKTTFSKKLFLFALAFFFVGVFFVRVDGVRNVAKASNNSDCLASENNDYEYCNSVFPLYNANDSSSWEMNNFETGSTNTASEADSCATKFPGYMDDPGDPLNCIPQAGSQDCPYGNPALGTCFSTLAEYCADANGNDPAACDENHAASTAECANRGATTGVTYSIDSAGDCVAEAPPAGNATDAQCKAYYGAQSYIGTDGNCKQFDTNTERCTEDPECVTAKGPGYKCLTVADPSITYANVGDCIPDSLVGSQCVIDKDCTDNMEPVAGFRYTCSGTFKKTCEQVALPKTPEELAAAAEAAREAAAKTIAAKSERNGLAQTAATSAAAVAPACRASADSQTCRDAQARAMDDDRKLREADAKLNAAMTAAAEASTTANGGSTSGNIPGLNMCANGVLAAVCSGGGGTPVSIASILGVNSTNPSGLPNSYNTTPPPVAGPKCGTGGNFQDIGGVCFPTNTGLSNASISTILANIFSWLMGLFTTLAVVAFVISGVQYFLASGDEGMAEKAKENATHAAIGIIVGLSGFIIIKAIAAALSGTSVLF